MEVREGAVNSPQDSAGGTSLAEDRARAKAGRLGPARVFGVWSGPGSEWWGGGDSRGVRPWEEFGFYSRAWPCGGRGRVAGGGVTCFDSHVQKPPWTNLWSPGAAATKLGHLGGLKQRKHITSRFQRPGI